MSEFWTFANAKRGYAEAMKPVVDPAGWTEADADAISRCIYPFSSQERQEVLEAVEHFLSKGLAVEDVSRENFPLPRVSKVLADVRKELTDGRGIVMLRHFPLRRSTARARQSPISALAATSAIACRRIAMVTFSAM